MAALIFVAKEFSLTDESEYPASIKTVSGTFFLHSATKKPVFLSSKDPKPTRYPLK